MPDELRCAPFLPELGTGAMIQPVSAEEPRVTADDLVELNDEVLARTASLARATGTALMVLGAVGAAAWLWLVARQQQLVGGGDVGIFSFGADEGGPSFTQRLDGFASTFGYLVSVALTAGFGLLLRVLGQYLTARTGGSLLSAVKAGDLFAESGEEEEEDYWPS